MICLKPSSEYSTDRALFILQIIPNGEEVVPAVLAFAEKLVAKKKKKKS